MADKPKTITINYRRADSAAEVGRIYDSLVQQFGKDRVFKDVDTIPIGVDFRDYLNEAVSKCSVLLAVIGEEWLTVTDEGGRRLDDPADFVRIEIEAALQRDIPVIPILVQGALMPKGSDLPRSLESLAYRNGLPIRHDPDFHRDMDRLIRGIEATLTPTGTVEAPKTEVLEKDKKAVDPIKTDRTRELEKTPTIETKTPEKQDTGQTYPLVTDEISQKKRQRITLMFTLGWFISGFVCCCMYYASFQLHSDFSDKLLFSALGGFVGALLIVIILKRQFKSINWRIALKFIVGWIAGVTVGWFYANGIPYNADDWQLAWRFPGHAIGGAIIGFTTSFLLSKVFKAMQKKDMVIITIGWSVAWTISFYISLPQFIDKYREIWIYYYNQFPFHYLTYSLYSTVIVGMLLYWQISRLRID